MRHRSLGLSMTLLLAGVCGGVPPKPVIVSDKPREFTGRVVLLPAPKGKAGARGVALAGDDRATYPLVADGASAMLAEDERLRYRPVALTAVRVAGTRLLRVVRVQTVKDRKRFDVDYWCEVCQISLAHPGPCYCCGQEVELRERPTR